MKAIHLYRVAHALHLAKIPLLPRIFQGLIFFLYNSSIPPSCQIGRGSFFGHGGIGVVLHPHCVIGARVLIGQGVTIGGSFGSGVPCIGDDVWIGPGARILGEVKIGNNVIVGANAVVVRDLPDNVVAAGVPAKVIRALAPRSLDIATGTIQERKQ